MHTAADLLEGYSHLVEYQLGRMSLRLPNFFAACCFLGKNLGTKLPAWRRGALAVRILECWPEAQVSRLACCACQRDLIAGTCAAGTRLRLTLGKSCRSPMGLGLLLASAASGALSRCVVHPLDTLRARLMVSSAPVGGGMYGVARSIVATEGVRGLYRGFGISVVMQAPAVATYLTSYDRAKAGLADMSGMSAKHPAVHLGAGLVAETISAVFWVPMEVIKQRAQVRTCGGAAASSIRVARDLLRHEGPRALFKGYGLTVGVFGPYSMIYFVSYERFKEMWSRHLRVEEMGLPLYAVASSASSAGAIAAATTTPLDIVKTRLQTQGDVALRASPGSAKITHYTGTWHAVRTIAAEEGVRGLTRGISARVLWIMPGTAITMSCFEFLKSKL